MKHKKIILIGLLVLSLTGCDKSDFEKYQQDNNTEEPQEEIPSDEGITFQDNTGLVTPIILSHGIYNEPIRYFYYKTPEEANQRYLRDVAPLISYPSYVERPYWDVRYINPIAPIYTHPEHGEYTGFKNAENTIGTISATGDKSSSLIQYSETGTITGGATLNLYDSPNQEITYGGLIASFAYRLANTKPWAYGYSNLMIQSRFNNPQYKKFEQNFGGNINFVLFLRNQRLQKELNYVITLYAYGDSWQDEQKEIFFDPTTNVVHIATTVKEGTKYSTKSPISSRVMYIDESSGREVVMENDFQTLFRVNITRQNLINLLTELRDNPPASAAGQDFGLSPEDWEVTSVAIQYELEETNGKALLSGSFQGFETFISPLPL